MSARFYTSRLTERSFVPRQPVRPHVRRAMHGALLPMDEPGMGGKLGIAFMFAVAAMIGAMLALGGVL